MSSPADFPSNIQFQNYFAEFVAYGYKPAIGTVEVRFPRRDGSRVVAPGSVGISDGQTKILIMVSVIAFLVELEVSAEDAWKDRDLAAVLDSFASVRCSYTEFSNPAHHYLHSLRSFAT